MDLWWSCMSVSQWTSFDGVVTFGLADHALEINGAVMVKWVQRTVLLQSCCDLTPRKSLKQFKITICQYQCYSISIFFAIVHLLQENNGYSLIYLKGSLIKKTESIWVIWTQLQLGDYNSRKSDLLFKWVHMVLHALPVPVWVFSRYSGFLPQLKHACSITDYSELPLGCKCEWLSSHLCQLPCRLVTFPVCTPSLTHCHLGHAPTPLVKWVVKKMNGKMTYDRWIWWLWQICSNVFAWQEIMANGKYFFLSFYVITSVLTCL